MTVYLRRRQKINEKEKSKQPKWSPRSQKPGWSRHLELRLKDKLRPAQTLRLQLPVVLFASPVRRPFPPVHQRVRWRRRPWKPRLLQPLVRLVIVQLAPNVGFPRRGVDRVLVLADMVLEEMLQAGRRLLNGVLDVVEVLAGGSDAVVEGVVVLGGGRRRGRLRANARVAAGLPPPP